MSEKMDSVDYQKAFSLEVALALKVIEWLLQKGFSLAPRDDVALDVLKATGLPGFLRKDPPPRKYLFGLIKRKPRRRGLLGTIWFSNSTRGANEQNWVIEAYRRKHIELFRQLAEEMASIFNVKTSLRLVRE